MTSVDPDLAGLKQSPLRQPLWADLLHVWSLFNLAVTQSYYSRLVSQPEYLIDPEVTPDAILCLGIVMTFVLPLMLVGLYALIVKCFPRCRDGLRIAWVFLTTSALLLQALHPWAMVGTVVLLTGLSGGVFSSWLYQRFQSVRSVVTASALGILLTPLVLYGEFWGADVAAVFRMERDQSRPRVPVVLVVFDEFPGPACMTSEGKIDETRFPNLAELSRTATWYRNACGAAPLTMRALPAILTGRFPSIKELTTPKDYPQNLFQSLVSGADYEHVAFEPVSVVSPQVVKNTSRSLSQRLLRFRSVFQVLSTVYLSDVLPAEFHVWLPEVPRVWFGLNTDADIDRQKHRGRFRYGWTSERDQQLQHFIECIDGTSEGVLYFGHFLLPHAPYCFFPSGKRYSPDSFDMNVGCLADGAATTEEFGLVQSQQRFLMQLMYLDQWIGTLIERLKTQGIYDECLLIVTADHGVSFRLGCNRRELSDGNVPDIARIPMFVKFPRQQQAAIRDEIVQSVDILPTILDAIGARPALAMDGLPLNDPRVMQRTEAVMVIQDRRVTLPAKLVTESTLPSQLQDRFRSGTDRWNLYRIGPHSEWLGRPLSEMSVNEAAAHDIVCLFPEEHSADLKHQEYFIEGHVRGPAPESPVELVVAVDGVIQATTRTYQQFGYLDRWSAMLPEWSYSSPDSQPEFYQVLSGNQLSRCRVTWEVKPKLDEGFQDP